MDIVLLLYNKRILLIQQQFIHIINAIFLGKKYNKICIKK